jgi:hypothetical protein
MNIVKFKDIYLKDLQQFTQDEMDWFNDNLKGKYAYALNWNWVIPFSAMTVSEFVENSRLNTPDGFDNYPYDKFEEFVDLEFTEKANSIDKYVALNKFSGKTELTIEDVKKFRTWLASTLLAIKDEESMDRGEKPMLEYYANNMYDTTVENLSIFSVIEPQYSTIMSSTCGCVKTGSIGSISAIGAVCDPLAMYRRGIYDLMVKLWSDHHYWIDLESDDFLTEFKRYIDAVISYNMPLYIVDWTNVFADCTCLNQDDALQMAGIKAMSNLSQALQYMIDGETNGHKNFIDSALRVFASQYYERMYWL